jgi:hypothetical protein
MSTLAEAIMNGHTLRGMLALTREELAAGMSSKTLMSVASDGDKKLAAWMARSESPHLSEQVAEHVCDALELNFVSVFSSAWAKYSELKKCAKETRDDARSTMDVALADHEFTYEMESAVDVLLDGVNVASIPFKFAAVCTVSGLELFLKKGCVYQVRSGKLDLKAEIRCAENVVWTRALAAVTLPGALQLDEPIAL